MYVEWYVLYVNLLHFRLLRCVVHGGVYVFHVCIDLYVVCMVLGFELMSVV